METDLSSSDGSTEIERRWVRTGFCASRVWSKDDDGWRLEKMKASLISIVSAWTR